MSRVAESPGHPRTHRAMPSSRLRRRLSLSRPKGRSRPLHQAGQSFFGAQPGRDSSQTHSRWPQSYPHDPIHSVTKACPMVLRHALTIRFVRTAFDNFKNAFRSGGSALDGQAAGTSLGLDSTRHSTREPPMARGAPPGAAPPYPAVARAVRHPRLRRRWRRWSRSRWLRAPLSPGPTS